MAEHAFAVESLTKVFATDQGPVTAVDGVSFEIAGAEFFTMLGPSGCGKTTTLRMVAGLERITSGTVTLDGRDFSRFSAFQRNIGMVFQSYALFPHLTVFENAAYGLRVRHAPERTIATKVAGILELLGLAPLARRHPADLSGGQQQRVSIARALVYDPAMLLLDEPLANLDAKLRVEMREEIRRIQKTLGIMTIYVTHDQEEAMAVSDRMAVLHAGKLMQAGRPEDVYADPRSLFVADFVGKANFFPVRVVGRDAAGAKVALASGAELGVAHLLRLTPEEEAGIPRGFDGIVMIRPEHLDLRPPGDNGPRCRLRRIQFLGGVTRYAAECPDAAREVVIDRPRRIVDVEEGDAASLGIAAADARLYYKASAR